MQSRIPGWVWLFTTVVAVGFGFFLYYLNALPANSQPSPDLVSTEKLKDLLPKPALTLDEEGVSVTLKPETEDHTEDQLDFYRMLTEQEVEVVLPKNTQPIKTEQPKGKTAWVLQAGSFRQVADANRMRADLILRGLSSAHVQEIEIDAKGTFYRVMVGPIASRSKMSKARDILAEANIAPIQKRVELAADSQ